MRTINILGFTINTSLEDVGIDQALKTINTINPHSYCVSKKDADYKNALRDSTILLPDGTGIVWAAKFLKGEKITRITGSDLHQYLLKALNERQGKVFYLGASPSTLQKIEERISKEYPGISVGSYSPPYKPEFSEEENQAMVSAVNEFSPDVLFVGMTAPKQEKWAARHQELLNTKIIGAVGAVFDFYAGTVKRPGKFWLRIGLEWLPRLLREPKRLWRRNFISTPCFILNVIKIKLFQSKD